VESKKVGPITRKLRDVGGKSAGAEKWAQKKVPEAYYTQLAGSWEDGRGWKAPVRTA